MGWIELSDPDMRTSNFPVTYTVKGSNRQKENILLGHRISRRIKLGILTWEIYGTDSLLEPASSGQSTNCCFMQAKIISIKRTKDLNYFSPCALNSVWPSAGPPRNNKTEMWADGTLLTCLGKAKRLWNYSWHTHTVTHRGGMHRGAFQLSTCTWPLCKSHFSLSSMLHKSSVQLKEAPLRHCHHTAFPVEYMCI